MKNFTKNKKIIIISIFIIFISNTVFAETFKQNGLIFIKGEHQPKKRVFEDESKYKTLKALEVYKQPARGKKLPLEQTEEYIESHKKLFKIEKIGRQELFLAPKNFEMRNIPSIEYDKSLDNLDLESKPKSIFSIIIDSIKKLWNAIFDIIFRLDSVEKRLDSLENNNERDVEIRSIEVDMNPRENVKIQNIDIQVGEESEENSEEGGSDDEADSREENQESSENTEDSSEEDTENNRETSNSDTTDTQDENQDESTEETSQEDSNQENTEDNESTESSEAETENGDTETESTDSEAESENTETQEEETIVN